MAETPETRTYVVKEAGFLYGEWRNANAHVPLTEAQARPFVLEGRLVPKEPGGEDRAPARAAQGG